MCSIMNWNGDGMRVIAAVLHVIIALTEARRPAVPESPTPPSGSFERCPACVQSPGILAPATEPRPNDHPRVTPRGAGGGKITHAEGQGLPNPEDATKR